jgi:hypothetical protein
MAKASKPRRPRNRCIFCGRTSLTHEHMYPNWLRNYIPRVIKNYTSMSAVIHPTHSEPRRRTIAGDPHSKRLHVVCAKCNNEWMSRLQSDAKPHLLPLILGQATGLDTKAQQTIAAWIAMSVMVGEFNDREKVAITATERRRFKKTKTAPAHWRIFIGDYNRVHWKGRWVHNVLPVSSPKHRIKRTAGGTPRPNTQTSTFVVGRLYVQALSSVTDVFEHWRLTADGARKLVQIWPIQRNIVGWPAAALTDREADTIAGAFFMFVEQIGRENRALH